MINMIITVITRNTFSAVTLAAGLEDHPAIKIEFQQNSSEVKHGIIIIIKPISI